MEPLSPGQEKRRLKRHTLTGSVNVYDRASKAFLGQVVNIHREGLMMMGNFPYKEGTIYKIDLHLPEPIGDTQLIPMSIDCLWTRDEDANRSYWVGCSISSIEPSALESLDKLIDAMTV
ncbi:hypothetical protein NBRC116494_33190 [Aurantivibrio plasticivorans]